MGEEFSTGSAEDDDVLGYNQHLASWRESSDFLTVPLIGHAKSLDNSDWTSILGEDVSGRGHKLKSNQSLLEIFRSMFSYYRKKLRELDTRRHLSGSRKNGYRRSVSAVASASPSGLKILTSIPWTAHQTEEKHIRPTGNRRKKPVGQDEPEVLLKSPLAVRKARAGNSGGRRVDGRARVISKVNLSFVDMMPIPLRSLQTDPASGKRRIGG